MPKFNYVAMDSRGKETKGTLEVANQNEAISRLKEMGYFPTKVVEAEKYKAKQDKKTKVAAADAKGRIRGGLNSSIRNLHSCPTRRSSDPARRRPEGRA